MSQHMHDMTAADHVLTVLPLFHVGGLNIQTTPALQLGATVTLHRALRAGRDARCARARQADADRAGAGHHPGRDRASALGRDRHRLPARAHHRLDAGAAGAWSMPSRRAACRCCRSTARPRPARSRSIRASAATSAPARPACPASCARRASSTTPATRSRPASPAKSWCAGRTCSSNTGATRRRPPRRCATAGIIPATSARATPTGISSSTTARRT